MDHYVLIRIENPFQFTTHFFILHMDLLFRSNVLANVRTPDKNVLTIADRGNWKTEKFHSYSNII